MYSDKPSLDSPVHLYNQYVPYLYTTAYRITSAYVIAIERQIVLRWATRQDIAAITDILVENFMHFELYDHIAPTRRQHPDEYRRFVSHRVKLFYAKSEARYMVAEASLPTTNGVQQTAIVGFATWEALGSENLLAEQWRHLSSGWTAKLERSLVSLDLQYYRYCLDRIVDYDALDGIVNKLHSTYEHRDGLQNCLHLQFLMVDPGWQRGRGIGRKLLQWGIDVAKERGLPVVIESSLVGYDFYLKHGFRLLEYVRVGTVSDKAYDAPIVVYDPREKP